MLSGNRLMYVDVYWKTYGVNEKVHLINVERSDKMFYQKDEIISKSEIDALLMVDPPSEDSLEQSHNTIQSKMDAIKRQIYQIIDITNKESQGLLDIIQHSEHENKGAQMLLGQYYTFLNECYSKLNQLDDLRAHEHSIFKQRCDLEIEP